MSIGGIFTIFAYPKIGVNPLNQND